MRRKGAPAALGPALCACWYVLRLKAANSQIIMPNATRIRGEGTSIRPLTHDVPRALRGYSYKE